MRDVEGKVAFITGGGSGVGLGMALVFARAGMKVAVADIRREHLDEALAALKGYPVQAIQVDVSDRAAMARAADELEAGLGPVDLLCNNAGVNMFAPIDECTYQDWDWLLGVNLHGVINGVQTFVPRMKARGAGGHIVNTASMASFIAGAGAGIYTTAKFAVRGLSESLWHSLQPHGIGVSVLCPGLVKSTIYKSEGLRPPEFATDTGPVDKAFMEEQLPGIHEFGMEPEEVGEKVLAAVRADELYIFPHAEFKDELRELFDTILAAVPEPDGKADPRRLAFEAFRRGRNRDAAAARKA